MQSIFSIVTLFQNTNSCCHTHGSIPTFFSLSQEPYFFSGSNKPKPGQTLIVPSLMVIPFPIARYLLSYPLNVGLAMWPSSGQWDTRSPFLGLLRISFLLDKKRLWRWAHLPSSHTSSFWNQLCGAIMHRMILKIEDENQHAKIGAGGQWKALGSRGHDWEKTSNL